MSDAFEKLTAEQRDRVARAFNRIDEEMTRFFGTLPFRYPRLIERGLIDRFMAAVDAVLPGEGDDNVEITEDEFDDAEVLLRALTEHVVGARTLKRVLATGGPELRLIRGGVPIAPSVD